VSQDQSRHDDKTEKNWITKAMQVTEQTMRGGRLDKPLADLTGLQHTARRKVAALLPQGSSHSSPAAPDLPVPPTPEQLAERTKRSREEKLVIVTALVVLLLTVWLRRKAASST
jgi:hypothetical protein